MNADGSGVTPLTDNEDDDYSPDWSPDGRRIAFQAVSYGDCLLFTFFCSGGGSEIHVMNADGSGVAPLTNGSVPAWSPDGRRIAFTSSRDGDPAIYVMNANGSEVMQLTDNSAGDYEPAWSPDGKRIAFTSFRSWYVGIYVMNADGSGVTRLTNNDVSDVNQ